MPAALDVSVCIGSTGRAATWSASLSSAHGRFADSDGQEGRRGTGAGQCRTRMLDAVDASSRRERGAPGYLGEVLVEEHPSDEFLA